MLLHGKPRQPPKTASRLGLLEPAMSTLPMSADEQYSGPQAETMDAEQQLASKSVDTTTRRRVDVSTLPIYASCS